MPAKAGKGKKRALPKNELDASDKQKSIVASPKRVKGMNTFLRKKK